MRLNRVLALAGAAQLVATVATADPLPVAVLHCGASTIASIGPRLEGSPESGSAVAYANGGGQVSYDVLPAIAKASRVGDHVFICLVFVPRHCPTGDDRGRIYTTTNLRTLDSWTLPDSQHSCGGA